MKVIELAEPNPNNSPNPKWKFINYLDTSNLNKNVILDIQRIEKGKYPSRAKRVVKKEDILISTVRPNQCHYGIIKKVYENMVVSTGFTVLTVKENVSSDYLYYYLTQKCITEYLTRIAAGSTTSYPSINPEDILNIDIRLVDKNIQENIANILSNIDKKIYLNNKIKFELENIAKLLYNYWFVQFDFPNNNGKPYRASGGKMEYNQILKREIPEGWDGLLLEEWLDFERGIEPGSINYSIDKKDDNYIPFYKVGNMDDEDSLVWVDKEIAENSIAKKDDILVSFDGTVGKIVIGLDGAFSTGIRKIYPKRGYFPKSYIYFTFQSEEIQKTMKQKANPGSNIIHASSSISSLSVPYNEEIVRLYNKKTQYIFEKLLRISIENQKLTEIRDFILPLLMNGQINVKESK